MNSDDFARFESRLQEFTALQNLAQNSAASVGEIMHVALVSGFSLFMAGIAISVSATGRPNWLLALFLAALPLGIVGLGGTAITTRLVAWKIQWWTNWIADNRQDQDPEPDQIRLIRLHDRSEIGGVDTEDLEHFIRVAYDTHDWTQQAWRNRPLPSGRPCHDAYWREMIEVLLKAGILHDYKRGSKGFLLGTRDETLEKLQLGNATNATGSRGRYTPIDADRGRE